MATATGALKIVRLLHWPFSEALGGDEVPGLLWLVAPLAVAVRILGLSMLAWDPQAHWVVNGAPLAMAALVYRKLVYSAANER